MIGYKLGYVNGINVATTEGIKVSAINEYHQKKAERVFYAVSKDLI